MNYNVADTDIRLMVLCPGLARPRLCQTTRISIPGGGGGGVILLVILWDLRKQPYVTSVPSSSFYLLWATSTPPPLFPRWAAAQMWTPCHSLRSHSSTFVFIQRFKLSKGLQVIRAYVPPHLSHFSRLRETDEDMTCGRGYNLFFRFPSFTATTALPWPQLLTFKEFNYRILNLLISLPIPSHYPSGSVSLCLLFIITGHAYRDYAHVIPKSAVRCRWGLWRTDVWLGHADRPESHSQQSPFLSFSKKLLTEEFLTITLDKKTKKN